MNANKRKELREWANTEIPDYRGNQILELLDALDAAEQRAERAEELVRQKQDYVNEVLRQGQETQAHLSEAVRLLMDARSVIDVLMGDSDLIGSADDSKEFKLMQAIGKLLSSTPSDSLAKVLAMELVIEAMERILMVRDWYEGEGRESEMLDEVESQAKTAIAEYKRVKEKP